ncbi:MAG TPA: hypothetical protein EYG25_00130, partial [Candidatus Poseidoniales archaeon]|nr:hypothetical protein [Candidatus Poseidoniales archaeon]
MRPRPFLLLLAGVALALMAAGEADAKEPEWSYYAGDVVHSVAISADGEYIAAGSQDEKVYFFDKDSSTPLWSYTTDGYVESVAISADGEYIAAGSGDSVYLFGKDSSTPLWSYNAGDFVSSVAISADGEYIAAASWDNKVYLFDKDSSTPLWSYTTGSYAWSASISADGEYIVAGSLDQKVYLFNKDSSTPLWSYDTEDYSSSIAISADGEYITAGIGYDGEGEVYLFDKDSSTPLWNYDTGNEVHSVAISADGEYIAAGSDDGRVYLFAKTGGGDDCVEAEEQTYTGFFSDDFENDNITYTQIHRTSNSDNGFYRVVASSSTSSAYSGQCFYRYYEAGTDSYTSDADDSMITPDSCDRDGSGNNFTEDICVDLRASYGGKLTYAIKWDLANGDRMEVRAATDFDSTQSDGTWTTLRTYEGSNGGWSSSDWVEEEISLSAFDGYQTWIDFRVVSNVGGGRGVLLDDLMVVGNEYVNNIAITDVTTDRFTAANTEHDLSITVKGIGTEPQQDVTVYARITDMDGARVWPSSSDWTFYTLPMGLNKGDTFTIDPQTAGASWNWGWGLDPGVYSLYVKAERSNELMLPDENPTDNAVRLTLVLGATLLSGDDWSGDWDWSDNEGVWSWDSNSGSDDLRSESFDIWNSKPFLVVESSFELTNAYVQAQVRVSSSGAWHDVEWRNPSQTYTLYAIPGAEYTNLPDSWTGSSYFDNRSRQTFYADLGAVEQISDGNGKLQEQYIGGPIQVRLRGVSSDGSGSFTGYNLLVMGLGSSGMDVKSISPTTQNAEPSSQLIPAERTYTVKLRNLGAISDSGVVDFTITAPENSFVTLESGSYCQGCPD